MGKYHNRICIKGAYFEWVERDKVEKLDLAALDDPFQHIPSIVIYVREGSKTRVLWCSAVYTGNDSEEQIAKNYSRLCHDLMEKIVTGFEKRGYTILRIARFTKAGLEYKKSNLYDAINVTMLGEYSKFASRTFFTVDRGKLRMNINLSSSTSFYATSDPEDRSISIRNKTPTPRGLVFGEFILNKWLVYFTVRSTAFRVTDVLLEDVLKEKLINHIKKHFGFIPAHPNFAAHFKLYPVTRYVEGIEELPADEAMV